MAFWTAPYRVEAAVDRDAGFYWQGIDGMPPDDASNDLFGQFVDFDGGIATTSAEEDLGRSSTATCLPDSLFMDHIIEGTASSVASSIDEFDFLSNSSHHGPLMSAASHDLDAQDFSFGGSGEPTYDGSHQFDYLGRGSMSDTELQRLEEVSIRSPQKNLSASHPSSPTPPNTTRKQPNKFVEALSSTIRKATTLRKSRKQLPAERAVSPTLERPPMAVKQRTDRMSSTVQSSVSSVSHESPPPSQYDPNTAGFISGFCDDPFAELPPTHPASNMRYYSQSGVDLSPMHSPGRRVKSEQQAYPQAAHSIAPGADANSQPPPSGSWPEQMVAASAAEQWAGPAYVTSQDAPWWDLNIFSDPKNASVNQAMHSQHAELPYEYAPMSDTNTAGLMIQMPPQSRPPQPTVVTDLALTAQTYLPPPPPIPTTERVSRPPRAPSSGARHRNMSCSPMRKTRGPSASPTPAQPQTRNQSRHSSTGSISSVRSASGRASGSIPNTPSGVRKRRSRDASTSGAVISMGGGDGFVNFTPNDGNILMTGVAPSGSSKTKARREKEAQERRRRLSEAAMKAVAAAGGDVDKLIQEGFVF